jgi:Rrf2 family protein
MKITTKTDYAVIILTHLASTPDKPVSLQLIAESAGISEAYLQRIAARLKAKGIIKPKHGAFGGYLLDMAPTKITLKMVIESVGDRTAAVKCTNQKCDHCDTCSARSGWQHFQIMLNNLFECTTIADMVK